MKARASSKKAAHFVSVATASSPADKKPNSDFGVVVQMIETARARAYQAVNTELIELYWRR